MNFPKLQGVIRVSNARAGRAFPIAPIAFTWADLPKIADPFIKRQGPDPVRQFLAGTNPSGPSAPPPTSPRPRPSGPKPSAPPATPPPPAEGWGLRLVVDNHDSASVQHDLPLEAAALPTSHGQEQARQEAAEAERQRLEQQRHQSDAKAVGLDSVGIVQAAKERDAPAKDVTPVVSGKASDTRSTFLAAFRTLTGRATRLFDTPWRLCPSGW